MASADTFDQEHADDGFERVCQLQERGVEQHLGAIYPSDWS
jgi:hypothetical protein